MKTKTFILSVLLILLASTASAKPTVFVSILPQKYFVEKIAGNLFDIQVMVLPAASPATYEPSPRQMAKLSKASLYFSIGVPFEKKWLPKIHNLFSDLKIVHTDRGIAKRHMHSKHHQQKSQYEPDPHIWLSPSLAMIQARHIFFALQEFSPNNRKLFNQNYHRLINKIAKLDTELIEILSQIQHKSFMVFHPSWGYFASDYRLNQIPIEIEGKSVKSSQLVKLIDRARTSNIHAIFAQPQFSTKSAGLIAREIGGQLILIDPLALDWGNNLRSVATKMKMNDK